MYLYATRVGRRGSRGVGNPGVGRPGSNRANLDGVGSKDLVPATATIAPLVIVPCEDLRSRTEAVGDRQNKLPGQFRPGNR